MSEADTMPVKSGKSFVSIQVLRGVAAIFVVINHCLNQITADEQFLPKEFFAFGVDIFFVISGFIMVHISNSKYVSPFKFAVERFCRVFPIYFLFTTAISLTIFVFPSAVRHSANGWSHYLLSIAFIPHINPATLTYSPLLRVGWTLNMEMYFYTLFAMAMALKYAARVWITSILIVLIIVVHHIFPRQLFFMQFYADDIVLEFVFGMVIALSSAKTSQIWPKRTSLALAAVAFALIGATNFTQLALPRAVGWGIPAALLVWSALMLDRTDVRMPRVLTFAGDSSYSLYLVHIFVISALRIFWIKLGLPQGSACALVLFILIAVLCAYVAAAASFLFIEGPIARALRRRTPRRSAAVEPIKATRAAPMPPIAQ